MSHDTMVPPTLDRIKEPDTAGIEVVVPLERASSTSLFCKICLNGESDEKLLQPCLCRGTVANIHLTCLERWINECGVDKCELCLYQFASNQTRRYPVWQSIAIWIRQPIHRQVMYSDLAVVIIMTLVVAFLITSLAVGLKSFWTLEHERYTELVGCIFFIIFITIVVIGYVLCMWSILKDNIQPWYRWWKNCNDIRLNRDRLTGPNV